MRQYLLSSLLIAASAIASPLVSNGDLDLILNPQAANLTHEEWEAQLVAAGIALTPPEIDHEWLNFTPSADVLEHVALTKRQNCYNTALVTDSTQTFVDWDVQMSPVVCATVPMTVSIAQGFSVSNAVSVSGGIDLSLIKDKLKSTLGIDYSRTWTTSTVATVTATVPVGECGAMIWKPTTTRRYGSVYEGCIGALKKTGTFMADDHQSASFEGFSWVGGARSFCSKKGSNPPLSRCQGSGNFV